MIQDVLSGIRRGTTTDALAMSLGLQRSTLMAMIEFLVDERYLEVVRVACACSPSCSGCMCAPDADAGSDCSRIYTLTAKGERFIAQKD